MKLGPKTKLGKRIKTRSRNFDDDAISKTVTSLPFPNLWQIWSNPEAGFQTHSLENVFLHQQ